MNERIKELSKQAWESITVQDALADEAFDQFDKKFAELIIKRIIENVECHADMYDTPSTRFICEKIVNSVKFDFGVEE